LRAWRGLRDFPYEVERDWLIGQYVSVFCAVVCSGLPVSRFGTV
jgi:hypothetical protein